MRKVELEILEVRLGFLCVDELEDVKEFGFDDGVVDFGFDLVVVGFACGFFPFDCGSFVF